MSDLGARLRGQARFAENASAAERWPRFEFVLIVAAGLAAAIVAAAVTSANVRGGGRRPGLPWRRASMVAVPIAVGLYVWHSRPDERFGRILVAAGFAGSSRPSPSPPTS